MVAERALGPVQGEPARDRVQGGAGWGVDAAIEEGARQTVWFIDWCGAEFGHLVVLDRRLGKSWEERAFRYDAIVGETTASE